MSELTYILEKAMEYEVDNYFETKSWLLTGRSLYPNNFGIQIQEYLLEKRRRNVKGAADSFQNLFRNFFSNILEELTLMGDSVRVVHMTKGKETEDQQFLHLIFKALPQEFQTEVLFKRAELSHNQFDKCQFMLLLFKLYPNSDTIPRNRPDILLNLLSYESDPFSSFRHHLVVELVPSLLESSINENLGASIQPRLIQIMNLCIEYYILAAPIEDHDRWTNLFKIMDKIGVMLNWKLMPFFSNLKSSGGSNVEGHFQALLIAYEHHRSRNYYSSIELAYVLAVTFLRCLVTYSDLIHSDHLNFGEKSKLFLVEIFIPRVQRHQVDHNLPILTTVSNSASVSTNQAQLLHFFLTGSKIWQIVNAAKGEIIEKDFFGLLSSLKWLKINEWKPFQDFTLDYQTYTGTFYLPDPYLIQNNLKLASYFCAMNNYKAAVEITLKIISNVVQNVQHENGSAKNPRNLNLNGEGSIGISSSENKEFSFFDSHIYQTDSQGNYISQRRVHFLSENRSEIIAYCANILIRCFHESIEINQDDRCIGHLMTLLQIEWPSPPAEIIFSHILDLIIKKSSFRYFPFFEDFVIEPDFLENFMALSNAESKKLVLDIWPNTSGSVSRFRNFFSNILEELTMMGDSVRVVHMTKGKETEDQQFLHLIFKALPQEFQTEVLFKRAELSHNQFDKCQFMLLLFKLYPNSDTIPRNRPDILLNLLSYESDPFSSFRHHLVVELVPSLLESSINENLGASIQPRLIQIMNLCIEYYILAAPIEDHDRWTNLFKIMDKIGVMLNWKLMPFFSNLKSSGGSNVEGHFQALLIAYEHHRSRNYYSSIELAYVLAVTFLRCLVTYSDLIHSDHLNFGEKSKLFLVEIFIPRVQRHQVDHNLPILTTVSNSASVSTNQAQLLHFFLTGSKIWQIVNAAKGEIIEKDFFGLLSSLKWLKINEWKPFQDFTLDYQTYTGTFYLPDPYLIQNNLKLASYFCAMNNYKAAVEITLKIISNVVQNVQNENGSAKNLRNNNIGEGSIGISSSENKEFSFFDSHIYQTDSQGNYISQRRVHFLSENRSEIIAYCANILIRCFHESIEINQDDRCIGHLMTLLQIEWPSPPAEIIFSHILDLIIKKSSFRYFPFFEDFVIEPDFLENFMALSNAESKKLVLDIWPNTSGSVSRFLSDSSSSRRMATRGIDKGTKNNFRVSMVRQMKKNGRVNLENLIVKFLTLNKNDIMLCFE